MRPRDLLNRWMVPLEKRVDFLAFKNGYKFPIPFDCMLIFATNLNPLELVDEAVIRADPNRTIIPGRIVDAVVVEPVADEGAALERRRVA